MNSKWEKIIYQIEKRAKIIDSKTEEFDVDTLSNGEVIKGIKEIIEFKGPRGKMKVERIVKPRVIDKKVISARRVGGKVAEDFVYSKDEKVEIYKIYQWNKNFSDWEEINSEEFL
ncbi:MAG: hypothetical protein BWY03_00089 [Parcubacteria group bacterium ADurb.Bin159]|jgi:hypothetical protein|nr:MAG: hypothetical protein BWY03_00089 [Parcubacteria group bacterium ADurb.Bin159]